MKPKDVADRLYEFAVMVLLALIVALMFLF
jgi:hypothetical protein